MKDKLKKEFHYFVLTDYEIEEEYLRKMHKNGYKFVKVTLPGIYYFEKSEPEDVVYKLDFNPNAEKQDFIQMYKDYGWEYLQDLNDYSYFRKKVTEAESEKELEIFSDEESKLDMLQRIFRNRMLPIAAIFFLCIFPQIMRIIEDGIWAEWGIVLLVLEGLLMLLYFYIIGRCLFGFYSLSKKYKKQQ